MAISNDKRASAVGVDSAKGASEVSVPSLRTETILLFAQANSGITDNLNTPLEVSAQENFALKAGYGSIANRGKQIIFNNWPSANLYVCLLTGDIESGVAATGSITFTGTATKSFNVSAIIAGKEKTIGVAKGATAETIGDSAESVLNSDVTLPITTTSTTGAASLTANMAGVIGNDISISVLDDDGDEITAATHGIDVTVVDMVGGVGATDVTDAVANIPSSLSPTRIIVQESNTTNLDAMEVFCNARADSLIAERLIAYSPKRVDTSSTTNLLADKATLELFADGRTEDERNDILLCGNVGLDIDFVCDIVSQRASDTSSAPGIGAVVTAASSYSKASTNIWFDASAKDDLLKKGISGIDLNGNVYRVTDMCVMYHPDDDNLLSTSQPINFYDEDITAIGNMAYAIKKEFDDNWKGMKFLEEADVSSASFSRKVSDIEITIDSFYESFVNYAFIRDLAYAKANKDIDFSEDNSERIDGILNIKLARTGRIYSFTVFATK